MGPWRPSRSALVNGGLLLLAIFALAVWLTGPIALAVGGLVFGGAFILTGLKTEGRWRLPLLLAGGALAVLMWLPLLDWFFGRIVLRVF